MLEMQIDDRIENFQQYAIDQTYSYQAPILMYIILPTTFQWIFTGTNYSTIREIMLFLLLSYNLLKYGIRLNTMRVLFLLPFSFFTTRIILSNGFYSVLIQSILFSNTHYLNIPIFTIANMVNPVYGYTSIMLYSFITNHADILDGSICLIPKKTVTLRTIRDDLATILDNIFLIIFYVAVL